MGIRETGSAASCVETRRGACGAGTGQATFVFGADGGAKTRCSQATATRRHVDRYCSRRGFMATRARRVDESAATVRPANGRAEANGWLERGARVFRLPGIYGPGRSALERVLGQRAHRIDLPDQVFSRIHVDDLAAGVVAGLVAPSGGYNLADDFPAGQNEVIEFACRLLGATPPLDARGGRDLDSGRACMRERRVATARQAGASWAPAIQIP